MEYELAIITPFGAGREEEISAWQASLEALDLGKRRTRLIVVDNSGSTKVRDAVLQTMLDDWHSTVYLKDDSRYVSKQDDERPAWLGPHITQITRRMMSATGGASYILSLETDVRVPTREMLKGATAYQHLKRYITPDVAMVGTALPTRWGNLALPSVYHLDNIQPWGAKCRVAVKEHGVEEIHAFGTSLLLMQGWVRDIECWPNPNRDGSGGFGHEWSVEKQCLLRGYKLLVNWDVKPAHRTSEGKWISV